jgi:CheY-like chemotaxis protein
MATVLVIDDQLEIRTLFQRVLENGGYRVVCVCDGGDALRVTESWKPDLMLLDLSMPQMDGLDFLRLARQRPSLANVPVIVLSGMLSPEQTAAARELGVADHLQKGAFTTRELRARVAKLLPPSPRRATTAA